LGSSLRFLLENPNEKSSFFFAMAPTPRKDSHRIGTRAV
jgi:hypothetical protein